MYIQLQFLKGGRNKAFHAKFSTISSRFIKRPNNARIHQLESSRNSWVALFPIFAAATDEQLGFPLQNSFLTLPKESWQAFFT